jgi:hypothetical protein
VIYRQRSTEFPFTININGPGASAIALEELPGELPLALIFSLLMTGIAWLATAGRMSFSREISLGISAREFALWCQPLQDARSGRCCGVEILLRWNNPAAGDFAGGIYSHRRRGQSDHPLTRYVIAETARRLDAFPATAIFISRLMSLPATLPTAYCCMTCTITGSASIRYSSWWSSSPNAMSCRMATSTWPNICI